MAPFEALHLVVEVEHSGSRVAAAESRALAPTFVTSLLSMRQFWQPTNWASLHGESETVFPSTAIS
jgi:hypothetical protein